MQRNSKKVIEVADAQVAYLAQRSKTLDQETRITVYSFSSVNTPKCLVYDKDVLRMPSIAGLYHVGGMTALIDATILTLDDLALTPEKYGEHAFLIYVLTDGQENNSRANPYTLDRKITALPDHWTVAAFVPDQNGVFEAKKFGFPSNNIALWSAETALGVEEAGERIRQTTDTFMQNRTQGIRGSRTLFSMNTVSAKDITTNLIPLTMGSYALYNVFTDGRIDEFVAGHEPRNGYRVGKAFYQLSKTELVQPQKQIAILNNADQNVYFGPAARQLLGLPDYGVKVRPGDHAGYTIFVQSTSLNRKLIAGTRCLVLR